ARPRCYNLCDRIFLLVLARRYRTFRRAEGHARRPHIAGYWLRTDSRSCHFLYYRSGPISRKKRAAWRISFFRRVEESVGVKPEAREMPAETRLLEKSGVSHFLPDRHCLRSSVTAVGVSGPQPM